MSNRREPKDTMDRKWRRWSKRTTEEVGRPLSVSDTFSGLMDIRRLAGTPPDPVYDTGSGVITFSGRLPPPSVVPPTQLQQASHSSSDWKIGLVAVVLAAAVVAGLALAVLLRDEGRSASDSPAVLVVDDGPPSLPAEATEGSTITKSTNRNNVLEVVPSSVAVPEHSDGERRRTDENGKNDDVGPPSLPAEATEGGTTTSTTTKKGKKKHKKKHKGANHTPIVADTSGDGPRPKTLSRGQVKAGMRSVAGKVKRCGKGKSGLVVMDVVIGKNGRVIRAHATGALAGSKTGKCAANAVKRAVFPEFSGPRIGVEYPFRL